MSLFNLTFLDVSEFVASPIRTGVQRVLVNVMAQFPRAETMAFRIYDEEHVAILDPCIFDAAIRYFQQQTDSVRTVAARFHGLEHKASNEDELIRLIGRQPLALLHRDRFYSRVGRIINLEAFSSSVRSRFYIDCPDVYRRKVIHLVHDFLLFEAPSKFPQLNWRYATDQIRFFEALCSAGGFIASTSDLAARIARYTNRPVTDVLVSPFGGDVVQESVPAEHQKTPGARRRVIVVGTIEPRKYPLEVARALETLARQHGDLECIVVGNWGWVAPSVRAEIEEIFSGPHVSHLTNIGDAQLQQLLRGSDVAVYVSSIEGFGLPVIEYAALGVPVVTNRAVPSAGLVEGPYATVLADVTTDALVKAVEDRLKAARPAGSFYLRTWAQCAEEIFAWRAPEAAASPTGHDPIDYWLYSVRLVREMRDQTTDWEELKRVIGQRLFDTDGRALLCRGDSSEPPSHALRADLIEHTSEIVSDNVQLIHWSDFMRARPLVKALLQCLMEGTHLEGINLGYVTFLGRPIDSRAAAEIVRMHSLSHRFDRLGELVHCGEATSFLDAPIAGALHEVFGSIRPVLSIICDPTFNIFDLFAQLGIPEPKLSDVMLREEMRHAGVPPLEMLMYFGHARTARGDPIDLLLSALCEIYEANPALLVWRNRPAASVDVVPTTDQTLRNSSGHPVTAAPQHSTSEAKTKATDREAIKDVPITSSLLFRGWYEPEFDSGYFRWMSECGSVANPDITRPIKSIVLRLKSVYGAAEPMLTCRFDDEIGTLRCEEGPDSGWIVHCEPTSKDVAVQVFEIDALVSDSPALAEGKTDTRRLSICITGITFTFG